MSAPLRFLVALTCLVILATALNQAREIVVPFLLALFIAVVCEPPMTWLRRQGLPGGLALTLTVLALLLFGAGLVTLIGASINGFHQSLPTYYAQMQTHFAALSQWLVAQGWEGLDGELSSYFDPTFFFRLVAEILSGFGAALTNAVLIVLTVIFILVEALSLPARLRSRSASSLSLKTLEQFTSSVNRYLGVKTLTSALTGGLVTLWLLILGIDHAMLWGLLAFLLNYIPNIGSFLAAIPAILLSTLIADLPVVLLVVAGYVMINIAVGNFLETQLMGRRLGLSLLVVFLSLVFWGWLLGPVGMLMSIPLTVVIKLALEAHKDTRNAALLLGPMP